MKPDGVPFRDDGRALGSNSIVILSKYDKAKGMDHWKPAHGIFSCNLKEPRRNILLSLYTSASIVQVTVEDRSANSGWKYACCGPPDGAVMFFHKHVDLFFFLPKSADFSWGSKGLKRDRLGKHLLSCVVGR